MNDIMVSICCTAYNHQDFIGDAIEGFLIQKTNFPIEIIIHDDASSDSTPKIIETFRKKYPDIIKPIYQTENQYSKGRKISADIIWPRASGKYIAVCEGDDFWLDPEKIQKQVDYMERNPECSMCFHGAKAIIFDSSLTDRLIRPYKKNRVVDIEDLIVGGGGFFPTASLLFRRDLINDLPEFVIQSSVGDFPMALFLASQGTIYYMDEIMSVYRYRFPGSWTSRNSNFDANIRNLENDIFVLESINKYTNFSYDEIISKVILDRLIDISELKGERWDLKEPLKHEFFKNLGVKHKFTVLNRFYFPQIYKFAKRVKKKYWFIIKKAAY